jgi:foldase protein PrsA
MTQQDILLRVKLDLISNKIRTEVTNGKDRVTQKQIEQYYAKNKQRFAQPEQRDLQVVLTKTRARALQARRAIQGGQSWPTVARRYSIDQASKTQGGRLNSVIPGQQEQALDQAVFKARRGELVGPVRTQFGHYVFRVTKVVPGSQQSLAQVRETIKRILQSQNQQTALQNFVKRFEKKWKSQTNCRKGFVVAICKNAPTPKRTSTVPPGAIPQGAPPSGAPPQGVPPQGGPPPGAPQQGAPPSGP